MVLSSSRPGGIHWHDCRFAFIVQYRSVKRERYRMSVKNIRHYVLDVSATPSTVSFLSFRLVGARLFSTPSDLSELRTDSRATMSCGTIVATISIRGQHDSAVCRAIDYKHLQFSAILQSKLRLRAVGASRPSVYKTRGTTECWEVFPVSCGYRAFV